MDSPDSIGDAWRRGFLGGLSDELRASVLEGAYAIEHPAGSATYRKQESRRLAVVISGLVRIYISAPDGREITLSYAGVGDLVGASAASGANLVLGAQAIERSSLLHLDSARFEGLTMTHPELSWALSQELEARLANAHHTVAMHIFARVRARVARDLLARVRALGSSDPGTPFRATHQELADAVGSVREVVARAVRDLRTAGVIECDQAGVKITDFDRLRLEAEPGD
jgi:CRP/FNR family transcriptional regulator, cyclic AMP receptor protein